MSLDLAELRAVLARTPVVVRQLLSGLPDRLIHGNEGPGTFSPFEVVGHLISGEEDDWIPRARIILAKGDDRTFAPFDRFRHRARDAGRPLDALLTDFARLREANLATLDGWRLGPAELALTGIHPTFGAVTLSQLLATWMVHDLGHIAQIVRVMARQHHDDVGPWQAFLGVLAR